MTTFQFTPEARLYARDFEVVEEMKKRFETNLGEFFDALGEALQARTWPATLVAGRQGKSYYLHVSRSDAPSAELEPCLWTYWNDPGVIRDRGVCWRVAHASGTTEQRAKVAAIAKESAVLPLVMNTTHTKWDLFEVWTEWAQDGDAVQVTADAVDPILRRLHESR